MISFPEPRVDFSPSLTACLNVSGFPSRAEHRFRTSKSRIFAYKSIYFQSYAILHEAPLHIPFLMSYLCLWPMLLCTWVRIRESVQKMLGCFRFQKYHTGYAYLLIFVLSIIQKNHICSPERNLSILSILRDECPISSNFYDCLSICCCLSKHRTLPCSKRICFSRVAACFACVRSVPCRYRSA